MRCKLGEDSGEYSGEDICCFFLMCTRHYTAIEVRSILLLIAARYILLEIFSGGSSR